MQFHYMTYSTRHEFFYVFHALGGIFSLDKPWKSESVSTFDVPFMSTVEHHGRHGGRDTMVNTMIATVEHRGFFLY